MILGKISSYENGSGLALIIDGETQPTKKKYKFLANYVPIADDRVLIEEIGDSYVVIGKVVDQNNSSRSRTSDYVWNRTHADRTYGIAFREQNSKFYIAYAGGPWHEIQLVS